MNLMQAVRHILGVAIPRVTPVAGRGISVDRTPHGAVIGCTLPERGEALAVAVRNVSGRAMERGMTVAVAKLRFELREDLFEAVIGSHDLSDRLRMASARDIVVPVDIPRKGDNESFLAVCLEDIATGEVGLAAVAGTVIANVTGSPGPLQTAVMPDGNGYLAADQTNEDGNLRLLVPDIAPRLALVVLGAGSGGERYRGPFRIAYDHDAETLSVSEGWLSRNGEFRGVPKTTGIPVATGYLCLETLLDQDGNWSEPVYVIRSSPDRYHFPIGRIMTRTGLPEIQQFHVTVAVFIVAEHCPFSIDSIGAI